MLEYSTHKLPGIKTYSRAVVFQQRRTVHEAIKHPDRDPRVYENLVPRGPQKITIRSTPSGITPPGFESQPQPIMSCINTKKLLTFSKLQSLHL